MNGSYDGKFISCPMAIRTVHTHHGGHEDGITGGPVLGLAVAEWDGCARAAFPERHPVNRAGSEVGCLRLPLRKPRRQLVNLGCNLSALVLQGCHRVIPDPWVQWTVWRNTVDHGLRLQLIATDAQRQERAGCSVERPLGADERLACRRKLEPGATLR